MKNITKLFIATGAAVILTSAARADEPLLSPHAKGNQPPKVSSAGSDVDSVRGQNDLGVAARSKASGRHSIVAGNSKNDPNLVQGQSAKIGSPKGLQQLRESGRDFGIAPLK